ncbi:unnamed protein product [Polarella glacialis]|uniref:Heme NO-binding domain-containing protein n=1 Tax=Polarella glacialis TaxID=89957 RepID=A0A813H7A7_POLGL|nr:unnamed protein product [Polarella glacialis]
MHGLFHQAFKYFILNTFPRETWDEILRRLGIENDATILKMEQHDDALTLAALDSGIEVEHAERDAFLELFGASFVAFAVDAGYYNQLRSLGSSLFDLLTNINLFHFKIERDFRSSHAAFPVFVVEGDCETDFQVRYSSSRNGLEPLVRGVLIQVAKDMYHSDLTVKVLQSPAWRGPLRIASPEDDTTVIWNLRIQPRPPEAQEAPGNARLRSPACSFSFFDLHTMFVSMANSEAPSKPVAEKVAAAASRQTVVEAVLEAKCAAINRIYDPTSGGEPTISERMDISRALFRGVPASRVAALWQDEAGMGRASQFWNPYSKLADYYTWSKDVESFRSPNFLPLTQESLSRSLIRRSISSVSSFLSPRPAATKITFLSHSWHQPANWDAAMGEGCSYTVIKAAEICGVAKDLAAIEFGDYTRWPEIHFWIDKCCIPQAHPELTTWCLDLLEEFIALSDRLVVILSWSYFERLWCVYEWVCFLVHNKASSITLCSDAFVRSRTLPLLLDSVRSFSLAKCKCFEEKDRQVLTQKVDTYFVSEHAFEQLLKFTAIAFIVRDMISRRADPRSPFVTAQGGADAISPWVELSKECGFDDLAVCFTSWRGDSEMGAGRDVQTANLQKVDAWFAKEIEPLIEALKKDAVRESADETSRTMTGGRQSSCSTSSRSVCSRSNSGATN